jgi:hypothetical protein
VSDEQPLPEVNDQPFVQDQVIEDIEARRQKGIETYGTALQPFNGRDALQDWYEELLDASVYAKQLKIEQDVLDKAFFRIYEGTSWYLITSLSMPLEEREAAAASVMRGAKLLGKWIEYRAVYHWRFENHEC